MVTCPVGVSLTLTPAPHSAPSAVSTAMLLTSPLFGASPFFPTSPASTTAAAAPRPNAPVGLEEIALHLFQLLYSAPLSLATLVRAGLLNDEAALLRYREEAPFAGHSAAAEGAARAAPGRDAGPGSAAAVASPPPPPQAPPLSPSSLPILRSPVAAPTTRPPGFAASPTAAPQLPPDAVARRLAALYREHPLYELRDVLHREATRLGYANYQDPASNDIVATAEALRQREMLVTAYTQLALMAHQQPGTPVSSFPTLDAVFAAAAASASETSAAAAMQDPEVATWAHGLHQLLGCHHQRERHCPHRSLDGQQRGTERLVAARAGDATVALEVAVGQDQPRGLATTTHTPAAAASASPRKRTRLRQRALTRGETSVALRFVQQLQGSRPVALTQRRERPRPPPRTPDGEQLGNVEMRARHGALNAASLPPVPNLPPTGAAAVPLSTAAAALRSLDCMNGLATEDDNASGGFDLATPARLTVTLPDSATPVAAARPATPHSPNSSRSSRSSTSTSTSSSSSSVSLSVVGEDEEEDEDAVFLHGYATDEDDEDNGHDTHAHAGPHGGTGGSAGQSVAPTAIAATGGAAAAAAAVVLPAVAPPTSAADPFANRTVARLTAAVPAAAPTSPRSPATTTAAAGAPVLGFQSPGNPLLAGYTDTRPFAMTELAPSSAADLLRLPYYAQAHEMNRLAAERGRSCYQDPHTGCLVLTSLFLSRLPHCYGEACAHCPHGEGCQRMQRHLLYSTGGGGGGGGAGAEERVGGGSWPQEAPRPRTRHARRQRGRRGWVAELSGGGGGGGRDCGSDASSSDADDPDTLRVLAELDAEDGLGPLSTPRPSSNGLLLAASAAAELASTPPQRSGGRRIDGAGATGGGVRRGRDRHVKVRSPASATSSVSAASFSDDDEDDDDDNDEAEQQQRSLLLRSAALSTYPSAATRNTAGLVVQVNSLRELLAWGGAGAGGGSPRPHARPQQRRHASRTRMHHDHDRRPPGGSCGAAERDGGAAARVRAVEPDWVDADAHVEELLRRREASLERFAHLDYAAL